MHFCYLHLSHINNDIISLNDSLIFNFLVCTSLVILPHQASQYNINLSSLSSTTRPFTALLIIIRVISCSPNETKSHKGSFSSIRIFAYFSSAKKETKDEINRLESFIDQKKFYVSISYLNNKLKDSITCNIHEKL